MKFEKEGNEVYIRLAEDEFAIIYTIRSAGNITAPRTLFLEGMLEEASDEESAELVRVRPRLRSRREFGT